MKLTKRVGVGILVGVLIIGIAGYGFYEIVYLQNQISQLQANNKETENFQSPNPQLQNSSAREELQFTDANAHISGNIFNITMALKNTGETEARIEAVLLDGQPINYPVLIPNSDDCTFNLRVDYDFSSAVIAPEATINGHMYLPIGTTWQSGMEVVVAIRTITGNLYPATISLL
jgi:hypothetical protein